MKYFLFLLTFTLSRCYTLVFEDDFDSPTLNSEYWSTYNNQTHSNEPQLYLSSSVTIEDGNVIITTRQETAIGADGKTYNFTSGWLSGENKIAWKYGKFEVRAKLPAKNATGAWPAHWLMPQSEQCWPTGGEIDIMEALSPTNKVYGSYHWGTECNVDNDPYIGGAYPRGLPIIDWSSDYHIFSVEWNETNLVFLVDDNIYEIKNSAKINFPTAPMYIILNTAISPWFPHPKSASWPGTHVIDWVRVWQLP